MKQFLVENPTLATAFIILGVAVALFFVVKVMQTIGMERVRGYVYKLFVEAEHEFKHGENEEKFDYVVCLARGAVPSPFNLFITERLLRKVIQTWFVLVKDLLDDGKLNGTGDTEEE